MSKAAELAALIGSQSALSNRNLVINGAMQVAQRGTSSTGVGASTGYFTLDRFSISTANGDGRATMSQAAVTDLPGFANCLKLDCTTADTSIAANEFFILSTRLEGQNVQQLKKGTSSAEPVTVSFYVKGNASATYVAELFDSNNARQYSQSFSVTSSWNRVSLTYAGDTTGALDDDNAISLQLIFWLHGGSNFTSGTLSTAWSSNTPANRAVGITSIFDSTDRTLEITGIQMELGEVATPFEHRSFGDELARCQRYYQVLQDNVGLAGTTNGSAEILYIGVPLNVPLRGAPSISGPSSFTGRSVSVATSSSNTASARYDPTFSASLSMDVAGFSGFTDNRGAIVHYSGGNLKLDSEL